METTDQASQVEGLASEDTTAQQGAEWPEGDPAGAPSHLFAAARAHLDCADVAMAEARGSPGLGAVKAGRQQGARDALEGVHRSTEQAGRAIARAVEVSEQLRAALLAEVEAIALRVVDLAHLANQAADVHTAAQRLGVGGKS